MRIAALDSNQQNTTNKQSFGILKPLQMTDLFCDVLKAEGDVFVKRLEQVLKEVGDQQSNNNFCDIELIFGHTSLGLDREIFPAVNITRRNGQEVDQFAQTWGRYSDLKGGDLIIKLLEDASACATSIMEKEINKTKSVKAERTK